MTDSDTCCCDHAQGEHRDDARECLAIEFRTNEPCRCSAYEWNGEDEDAGAVPVPEDTT